MSWDYIPGKNAEANTIKTMRRRAAGALARENGNTLESIIEESLLWYEGKGITCAEKTPEPMRPLGKPNKRGQFLACYEKKAQPDFKGTLTGGRSVVFEAKNTDSDRIEYSRLTNEQIKKLRTHHALGAAAFVLVSFGLRDFYRIPWEVWEKMKDIYGHKHMKQAECEPYRVQYVAGVLKLLEGIELRYKEKKEPEHE